MAGGSAPLGLNGLPEDCWIHTGKGAFETWVELDGCRHICFRLNQGEVVFEFGDPLGQGVGLLRQGDH
jgi:hypothetical protein